LSLHEPLGFRCLQAERELDLGLLLSQDGIREQKGKNRKAAGEGKEASCRRGQTKTMNPPLPGIKGDGTGGY